MKNSYIMITDPEAIADGFNNYFVNIGPTLASKIPNSNLSHRRFLPENLNFSLFLEPANEMEIKNIIGLLNEGAPGQDDISSKNIKRIKDSISYPLTNIVNLSFEQGVFPKELKIAVIKPLYKAKDPSFFNNYRPISLLSVFSKIIERLMYNRLLNFINKHDRQQSVVYNGQRSELKLIRCGVPQGSILGPLLFLLNINDLKNVSSFFMPILFADDTNLFCTGTELKEMIWQVNEEMAKIYAWINANRLS